MKALVTGGAGFVGAHLTGRLLELGHRVVALDDLSTGSRANLAGLSGREGLEFVHGSVLDAPLVDELAGRVDAVFHLAAAVGVSRILADPLRGLRTNLGGTETVLECAQGHATPVLVASTSEVYGHNTADALAEDDVRVLGSPLTSRWSYAEAKAIDETLAYAHWRQKGLSTVIVRLFNIVGPGQSGSYGMVIPRFVDQALAGQPLTVYGDGSQTRCFCHVSEAVDALITLVGHPGAYGRVFNLGRPAEVSIRALAERVIQLSGSPSSIHHVPVTQAYAEGFEDMARRVPDIARLRDLIDFDPQVGLDEILRRVIDERSRASRSPDTDGLPEGAAPATGNGAGGEERGDAQLR